MKQLTLLLLTVAGLALSTSSSWAANTSYVATVSGKSTVSKLVGADMKIVTTTLNNAALCVAMGVDPKKYTVVYDTNTTILQLIPKSSSAMLPTKQILLAGSDIEVYSTTQTGSLSYYSLSSGANAGGTPFDTLNGVMTVLFKLKVVNGLNKFTGVMGSVTGAATGASPLYPLYTFTFTATKAFVQTP